MEAAGLAFGVTSLLGDVLVSYETTFRTNRSDYGFVRGFALETIFFQARRVVERIRRHVLAHPGDDTRAETQLAGEAWSIKDSYASSLGMVAVAGAIVAQIAITALSLEYLEDTHWTASAAFVISLVAGLLSVYFACIVQQQLSSLHSPDDTKSWLTAVRTKRRMTDFLVDLVLCDFVTLDPHFKAHIIPSYNAALLLVLPSILLNWSSIALLIGIGIYYGLVHARNLGTLQGSNSNLAILLVYVLFTSGALMSYVIPWFQKMLESTAPVQSALDFLSNKGNTDAQNFAGAVLSTNNTTHNHFIYNTHLGSRWPDSKALSAPCLPAMIYRQPRMQADAWASQTPALQPDQTHQSAAPKSNTARRRADTPRPAQIPTFPTPDYNAVDTQSIMLALQASIAAQKASLQAQEALLQQFRASESLQPPLRRASFRL